MALVLDTVLVVVVKLMHVLIDGKIGITGITTEKNFCFHSQRNVTIIFREFFFSFE